MAGEAPAVGPGRSTLRIGGIFGPMGTPRLLLGVAAMAMASAGGSNAQPAPPTAAQITTRIVERTGIALPDPTVDTFKAGDPGTPVRGIAVTMMATLDVIGTISRC